MAELRNRAMLRKTASFFSLSLMLAVLLLPIEAVHTSALAESSESKLWAVFIGVSEPQCPVCIFDKEWNVYPVQLQHPDDGARDMAAQLLPITDEDHVKIVLNEQGTTAGIYYAIKWLAENANDNDTVLLYFCGHSAPQYLGSYDYIISDRQLAEWLDLIHSEKFVVILDTCYAGSFGKELGRNGRVVLMSCQPTESSLEDRELKHTVFTHYILQSLTDFDGADTNGNYELSAKEIFDYANPKTVNEIVAPFDNMHAFSSGNVQHPTLYIPPYIFDGTNLFSKVIFHSDAESATNATILYADGKSYLSKALPPSFSWLSGTAHSFKIPTQVDTGDGTRLVFTSWNDGDKYSSRVISHGGEYTAEYKTQYALTVESPYGSPRGNGWYDSGSIASFSINSDAGGLIQHIFTGWSGDFTGQEATSAVTMDKSKTVKANWQTNYLRLYLLITGIIIVIAGITAAIVIRKKKMS